MATVSTAPVTSSAHSFQLLPAAAAQKSGEIVLNDGTGQDQAKDATVGTPHPAWLAMRNLWALIDALMGGTLAMRAWGKDFLHQEPGETDPAYVSRLKRTFLFNGLESAIRSIVAKPFSRDVSVKEEEKLDERVQVWTNDTDGEGTHLTGLLSGMFEEAQQYGFCHVLTDMGQRPEDATAEYDQEQRVKSVVVSPTRLFNWAFDEDSGELERVHISEERSVKVGNYGTQFITCIRILWRDRFEVWKPLARNESGQRQFELIEFGPLTGPKGNPLDRVPIRTYYVAGSKKAEMVAIPPHQGLAEHNLDHWQTYSDYANIVHFVGVPILFAKGFSKDEEKQVNIASITSTVYGEDTETDLKYVEHKGSGVSALREKLQDLEEAMRQKGMEPFMPNRSGDVKATEVAVSESKSQSKVQRWITDAQSTGNAILKDVHRWFGIEMPEDAAVDIFQDFSPVGSMDDLKDLSDMQMKGQLSLETLLHEARRRGRISEATDIQEEIARIEEEKMDDAADVPDVDDDVDDVPEPANADADAA